MERESTSPSREGSSEVDELETVKALEEMLSKGLVEERYDEGKGTLVYRLTEKGEQVAVKLLCEDVDAFDTLFNFVLYTLEKEKASPLRVLEFLLWFIYHVHYGLSPEEAKKRAKQWIQEG